MSLFGKKKHIRFETITIEREREVFRALGSKGWTLCTDPFQFDVQKSHEKLRKDALRMAKELNAELVVEVWDPIFQHMHWKGLKYSAWRRATPEELRARQKELSNRPDYSDSLGSYDEIARKLEEKKLKVSSEEVKEFANAVQTEDLEMEGEVYGNADEDMGMRAEDLETMSTFNPYDHQGEALSDIKKDSNIDIEAAEKGPVFDNSFKLQTGAPEVIDNSAEIDPLAMMMEAAPSEEKVPISSPQAQPPQVVKPAGPPMEVPMGPPPIPTTPPQPPMVKQPAGTPAEIPPPKINKKEKDSHEQ